MFLIKVNNFPKLEPDIIRKAIIIIQSHVRGLMFRKKFNNKIFLVGKFLPYLEPDLPYKPAENYLITNEEINYLFSNFSQVDDTVKVVCLKTIEYTNGCQYYGEWNQQYNQKHGRGIQKWPDGPKIGLIIKQMDLEYIKAKKLNMKVNGKMIDKME